MEVVVSTGDEFADVVFADCYNAVETLQVPAKDVTDVCKPELRRNSIHSYK